MAKPTTVLVRTALTRTINQPQTRHCAVNTNCMTMITLILKMTPTQVVETSVTTNNSPYQDYTNPDDQLTTNTTLCSKFQLYGHNTIDSEDDSHIGCRNVSHNQQQSLSGLHQPDDQLTTNTTLCSKFQLYGHNTIDSEDDSHIGCRNVSHNQQQSLSGLYQPGQSTNRKHDTVL